MVTLLVPQPVNIPLISVTFEVLKLLTFRLVKLLFYCICGFFIHKKAVHIHISYDNDVGGKQCIHNITTDKLHKAETAFVTLGEN